jgi:hypothetical protein
VTINPGGHCPRCNAEILSRRDQVCLVCEQIEEITSTVDALDYAIRTLNSIPMSSPDWEEAQDVLDVLRLRRETLAAAAQEAVQ